MALAKYDSPYEKLKEDYYNRYLHLAQYKKGLADGTITHDDLKEKAAVRAQQELLKRDLIKNRGSIDANKDLEDDANYRASRLDVYEKAYGPWDDAGDIGLLMSLVELETVQQGILRDLTRATTLSDKERYWKAIRENAAAQRDLQVVLGIDKKSRDQARISGNPMENWEDIKGELADWVDMLMEEFPAEAKRAKTEERLRDLMKYKLSLPLAVVDSIVYNLKRVNGISTEEEAIV